jgi:hypothetical protein
VITIKSIEQRVGEKNEAQPSTVFGLKHSNYLFHIGSISAQEVSSMEDMSPIISEFLTESFENLDQLDQDLVDLEANPEEKSLLARVCWRVFSERFIPLKAPVAFWVLPSLSLSHTLEKICSAS